MSVAYKCSWTHGEAAAASPFLLYEEHPKWPRFHLTYVFETDFPHAAKAALLAVSEFRFTEIMSPTADLKIGLYSGKHCDDKPFDGPGGALLAHAFPPTNGRLHFNKDKDWSFSEEADSGFDFERVAVHELGHILGLDHSNHRFAVMYKEYFPGEIRRELHEDDIEGITYLYSN